MPIKNILYCCYTSIFYESNSRKTHLRIHCTTFLNFTHIRAASWWVIYILDMKRHICNVVSQPLMFPKSNENANLFNHIWLMDTKPISVKMFSSQFNFDGIFAMLWINSWSSNCNKYLDLLQKQSCHIMRKMFAVISLLQPRKEQNAFSNEFAVRWKEHSEISPSPRVQYCNSFTFMQKQVYNSSNFVIMYKWGVM